ncbi:MAG: DUF4412 domain-containing protein [Xanthomonadales bacterium]|nr:DUF4412 domain-containing protein [Xanthomonadales bacterium]
MTTNEITSSTRIARHGKARMAALLSILVAGFSMLAVNTALAVHPYQKWADEFGIDLEVSYDGTRVMKSQDVEIESREHRAPQKMYTEMAMGGMTTGILLREDLDKAYILMHSMGFYREQPLSEGIMAAANNMEFSEIEKVGREEIIGFPSTKFKTRFEDKEGKGAGHFWVTDSGVPIKMDMIYSSRGEKGQRILMEFTELNLREQDPEVFEIPEGLQPMNFGNLGALGQLANPEAQASQPSEPAAQTASADADLSARQQACLEEAMKAAEEKKEKEKKKRAFGKLLGAVASAASRFGSGDLARTSADVYSANATAQTVSQAAEDLGISEEEVERCREP